MRKRLSRRNRFVLIVFALSALAATSLVGGSARPASAAGGIGHFVRTCAAVPAGQMRCFALHRTTGVIAHVPAGMSAAVAVNGFGPSDLDSAYSVPTTLGSGKTVAIVDAYNDPNAESDLATYRSNFGLPPCTTANGCFKKESQTGSTTSLPANNTGWAGEEMLDIEMVSAICPIIKEKLNTIISRSQNEDTQPYSYFSPDSRLLAPEYCFFTFSPAHSHPVS